jgi:hypothetical protein
MYSMNNIETRVDAKPLSSSQERIVIVEGGSPSRLDTRESEGSSEMDRKSGGISKTVEFEFHESAV